MVATNVKSALHSFAFFPLQPVNRISTAVPLHYTVLIGAALHIGTAHSGELDSLNANYWSRPPLAPVTPAVHRKEYLSTVLVSDPGERVKLFIVR